jgi:hypothetical protein
MYKTIETSERQESPTARCCMVCKMSISSRGTILGPGSNFGPNHRSLKCHLATASSQQALLTAYNDLTRQCFTRLYACWKPLAVAQSRAARHWMGPWTHFGPNTLIMLSGQTKGPRDFIFLASMLLYVHGTVLAGACCAKGRKCENYVKEWIYACTAAAQHRVQHIIIQLFYK